MSKKKLRREQALMEWKRKWGIEDYRFYIYGQTHGWKNPTIYMVHKDVREMSEWYNELRRLDSLISRLKHPKVSINMVSDIDPKGAIFHSLDELKHYCLLRKLAGI